MERTLGVIVGGGAVAGARGQAQAYHLALFDLDAAEAGGSAARCLPVPFLAHGVDRHPERRDRLVMFEKQGPGAAVLDLATGALEHTLSAAPGRQFYGHGAFSPDGAYLYCTETDLDDGHRGYVAVRDGRDLRYLGDFPTHGCAPHDCQLRDGGATLVITNGGAPAAGELARASVTWVDVDSGALRRREPVPGPGLNAGHLAVDEAGDLAVVSAPAAGLDPRGRGGVSLRAAEGELRTLDLPASVAGAFVGETLSVAIHAPTRTVAATQPEGHVVTFWSLDTGTLRRSLRVPNPRGVGLSLDGRELLLTFGGTAKVCRIDPERLAPVDAPGNREGRVCGISGSHFAVYDLDTGLASASAERGE